MLDLYNNKYDRHTLKENIYAVKLLDIVKTQTLDVSFIVRYILNESYQLHEDDKNISIETICNYQHHIDKIGLTREFINYDSDDDSIDDFETFSNR